MFFCIMLVLLQIRATQSAIQNFRFQKSSDCRGMALAAVDRYQTIRARGIVECVNFCGLDSRCLSVVFDTSTLQCCLGAVKAHQNCSNMEPASEEEVHLELIKPCTNYGVSSTDERCDCLTLADCPTLARGKGTLPVITVQDCGHCYNVLFADS
ncbi:uncharacterized protein LOC112561530 [Pomacea canaliculata]|uniref:uncharacterized protein LOC112561530 n=1 Tax=Pomacea canaliculata TaxID=400727 RepID=UPI000D738DD3|nr:uncharacterized protein LOC112561530 [Pomacea canaliculata]